MILVTGGCFQGKTEYACETFHIAKEEAADGMDCPMEAIYETKLLYHFHEYIKRCMEANQELDLEEPVPIIFLCRLRRISLMRRSTVHAV